jgi:hypothetical protein
MVRENVDIGLPVEGNGSLSLDCFQSNCRNHRELSSSIGTFTDGKKVDVYALIRRCWDGTNPSLTRTGLYKATCSAWEDIPQY